MVIALSLWTAPVQCGDPEPVRYAHEEHPARAVWTLSERLRARGHARAAEEAWRYLVERWPSSRWAERARLRLEGIDREVSDRRGSAP